MSFRAFFDAIASPDLRQVAQHWDEQRGARPMPGWEDIRPARIAAQLPFIWVYKFDRAAGLFTGRLAGDRIEQVFGKSFRGTAMGDLYAPADYPHLYARGKRVVCEPAFFRGAGMVFKHMGRIGRGERIIMPLAEDGTLGDGIFGATIYKWLSDTPTEIEEEAESWFAL